MTRAPHRFWLGWLTQFLRLGGAFMLAWNVAGQTPRPTPSPQKPANSTAIHSTNSSEGSRVSLSSDQSLNDYEAYRSGNRFYVRIPRTNLSSQAARGRGFDDVNVQNNGDSTVLSFRLQPGATARVEQRSNQLDVVFKAAGAAAAPVATNTPDATRPTRVTPPVVIPTTSGNRSPNPNLAPRKEEKPGPTPTPANTVANAAKTAPSPSPSPMNQGAKAVSSRTPSSSAASNQSNQAGSTADRNPTNQGSSTFRERLRYWMLFASLNPVPVIIGLAVLLLLIVFLFFSRRRAPQSETTEKTVAESPAKKSKIIKASKKAVRDVAAEPKPVAVAISKQKGAAGNGERDVQVTKAAEQVKHVLAGESYDPAVIGAEDPAMRQIVAAELLSALAGRNGERQNRARDVFMNHGYFEDATRDLRIADSPAERAAAARRLSFVRERDATPHLTSALEDSAPEVRRAAVEALLDQHDPDAVDPLKELLRVENDRQVPHELIRRAIDASATNGFETQPVSPTIATHETMLMPPDEIDSEPDETEREVIEL